MVMSRWRNIGYGSAETGVTACEFLIQLILLKFYTDQVGLSPWLAGLALGLATVWDAITDPLIGYFSDRTTSPFGRRRPYMLAGMLILACSFYALFSPPEMNHTLQQFSYLLFGYMVVNTGISLISVPHLALAADLTQSLEQRSSLFGWRFLFANLGLLSGILLPTLLGGEAGNLDKSTTGEVALYIGLVLLLTVSFTLVATRGNEGQPNSSSAGLSIRSGARAIFANKPYLWLLASNGLGSIGRAVNASLALFYYQYFLELNERTVFIYILLPFTGSISLSVLFWVWVSKFMGKQYACMLPLGFLAITTGIVYMIFPTGEWIYPAFYAVIAGWSIGSVFLLDAMVSDVCDYDRIFSGQRREGLYYGFWRLDSKLSRAVGLALSGIALEWIGFETHAKSQTDETQWGLAFLFGPVVGVIFMFAAGVLYKYPISLQKEQQINRIIQAKDAANKHA